MRPKPTPGRPLVVFDIGNVLLNFSLKRAEENFTVLEGAKAAGLVNSLWSMPLSRAFECGEVSAEALFNQMKQAHGLGMGYAEFQRCFNDIFTPIPDNLAFLEEVAEEFPVALLSNTNEVHWDYMLSTYPVLKKAHWPLGSHQAGLVKPDPAIYRALADLTGAAYAEMVYVDDILAHVEAARRLGVRTIHYSSDISLRAEFARHGVAPRGKKKP